MFLRERIFTENPNVVEVRVGNNSDPRKVAGCIAGHIRDGKEVVVSAVRERAVCNAAESVDKASQYLRKEDIYIGFVPEFSSNERGVRVGVDPENLEFVYLRVVELDQPLKNVMLHEIPLEE